MMMASMVALGSRFSSSQVPGFTKRYNIDQLVYYETFHEIHDAIAREKQLKGCTRKKKIALIEGGNPNWEDLAATIDTPTTISAATGETGRPGTMMRRDSASPYAYKVTESTWDSVKSTSQEALDSLKDEVQQSRQWLSDKIAS